MMDIPLNSWLLFSHAERHYGDSEIATKTPSGSMHRYSYAEFAARACQLMHALDAIGCPPTARVATLGWNDYRHLEAYFAVPCTGRVLHTLNLRLSPAELAYIVGHAGDDTLLVDEEFLPLVEAMHREGARFARLVVMRPPAAAAPLPAGGMDYEDLLVGRPTSYPQPPIPENTPLGLCYTSGTTGRPKGVVYTHRSTYLHALAATSMAGLAIGPADSVFPVVPMFHANAWGMPYAAVAAGARIILNGPHTDPASLVDLLVGEAVSIAAGVPTIWLTVAAELDRRGAELRSMRHIVCGGSQPPAELIRRYLDSYGVPIIQIWGMTETSPLCTAAWPRQKMAEWPSDRLLTDVRTMAGLPLPGVDVSIRREDGGEVPWDGVTMGDLLVRGPWITDGYLGGEGAEQFTVDGWLRTGDVAIGTPDGYIVIADRTKDLIKSGGEWISSIDMEAAIMGMQQVAEAVVIAVPDAKWQERPLAVVALADGHDLSKEEVHAHLLGHGFARWQLPDRVEVLSEVPRTSVGKFDKKVLRARFAAVQATAGAGIQP